MKISLALLFLCISANLNTASAEQMQNSKTILETKLYPINEAQDSQENRQENPEIYNLLDDANIQSTDTFTPFTMSSTTKSLSLNDLRAGEPYLRTIKIQNEGSLLGSVLFAYQEDYFKTEENEILPDTTCDTGNCTFQAVDVWKNPLTFGVGMRCESANDACNKSYQSKDMYSQIANRQKNESPYNVGETQNNEKVTFDIIVKLNLPQHLDKKTISSSLHFISIPKF